MRTHTHTVLSKERAHQSQRNTLEEKERKGAQATDHDALLSRDVRREDWTDRGGADADVDKGPLHWSTQKSGVERVREGSVGGRKDFLHPQWDSEPRRRCCKCCC